MKLKLDLEKAYDRLSQDFIKDTLVDGGLPLVFSKLLNALLWPL